MQINYILIQDKKLIVGPVRCKSTIVIDDIIKFEIQVFPNTPRFGCKIFIEYPMIRTRHGWLPIFS